ncbi:hypothetical protein DFP72DRAFT_861134 [Ephemerocybe angulata]|uniref:Uncharacterized protein n=1 Tax=Ephemerocybe angulata TaxID=980116 RepID=A0A8H6H9M3_9AGAR|nr:hypothetical protein DFP72DRAFT_861134 [Tulosesus angulatus]
MSHSAETSTPPLRFYTFNNYIWALNTEFMPTGPYRIVTKISDHNYLINVPSISPIHRVYAEKSLRPYIPDYSAILPSLMLNAETGPLRKILQLKICPSTMEVKYRVSFVGLPDQYPLETIQTLSMHIPFNILLNEETCFFPEELSETDISWAQEYLTVKVGCLFVKGHEWVVYHPSLMQNIRDRILGDPSEMSANHHTNTPHKSVEDYVIHLQINLRHAALVRDILNVGAVLGMNGLANGPEQLEAADDDIIRTREQSWNLWCMLPHPDVDEDVFFVQDFGLHKDGTLYIHLTLIIYAPSTFFDTPSSEAFVAIPSKEKVAKILSEMNRHNIADPCVCN